MKRSVGVAFVLLAALGSAHADDAPETLFHGRMTLPWSTGVETHHIKKLKEVGPSGLWSQLPIATRNLLQFSDKLEGQVNGRYLVWNHLAAISAPDRGVEIVTVETKSKEVVIRYRVSGAPNARPNVHLVRIDKKKVRFERLPDTARRAGTTGLAGKVEGKRDRPTAVCHTYGCKATVPITLPAASWETVRKLFTPRPATAAEERARIATAIGLIEGLVGPLAGTDGDKGGWGGNFSGGDKGDQDCIDEATNTTTYLGWLVGDGLVRFHKPELMVKRGTFGSHFSASMRDTAANQPYVVDSWFRDNGHPAVIQTLKAWKKKTKPAKGTTKVNLTLGD